MTQTDAVPQGTAANAISLLLGHPDPATLLTPEFRDAASRVLGSPDALRGLQYGIEQGNPALIEFLVANLQREQGIPLSAEQMMIVAGSTHAVDMIARLYTRPGDAVIVEAPTYADALHIFRDHGAALYSVPLDDGGVIVVEFSALLQRLAASGKTPRLFYTIPSFGNPSGVTLAAERRPAIIQLARQYGMKIVEDDVYRQLAYDAQPPASFFAQASDVFHIGSFSKTLAPGLRLGWLLASPSGIQRFVSCGTTQMGGGASPLSAQIVAEYCRLGYWEPHVSRLRDLYRMRRDRLLAALDHSMPSGVRWTRPAGGFFVWVTLPPGVYGQDVKRQALERGVMVAAGEGYFVNPADGAHHLRLTFSFAPPDDLDAAVRILSEVIGEKS